MLAKNFLVAFALAAVGMANPLEQRTGGGNGCSANTDGYTVSRGCPQGSIGLVPINLCLGGKLPNYKFTRESLQLTTSQILSLASLFPHAAMSLSVTAESRDWECVTEPFSPRSFSSDMLCLPTCWVFRYVGSPDMLCLSLSSTLLWILVVGGEECFTWSC
jgi:hypothetical protein